MLRISKCSNFCTAIALSNSYFNRLLDCFNRFDCAFASSTEIAFDFNIIIMLNACLSNSFEFTFFVVSILFYVLIDFLYYVVNALAIFGFVFIVNLICNV
jgi:hypothetical protein